MKKYLISLLIISMQASSAEVWVASAKPISREALEERVEKYRSQIKGADFVSSYEYLLGHPADEAQMAMILDLDSVARSASLNGNFKKGLNAYMKLLEKLRVVPNVAGIDKITLSTKINIAHMATMLKLPLATRYWANAHAWAPQAVLSPEEFSPAVILQFSSSLPPKRKSIQIKAPPEAAVFVDGKRIKQERSDGEFTSVQIESGDHQLSVLVPGFQWSYKNFEIRETTRKMIVEARLKPMATGSCDQPQYSGEGLSAKVKLLVEFDDNCPRIFYNHSWYNMEGSRIVANRAAAIPDELKPEAEGVLQKEVPKGESFIGRVTSSPWFWAGIGAVVVGAIVYSNSGQTTTTPSHTMQ